MFRLLCVVLVVVGMGCGDDGQIVTESVSIDPVTALPKGQRRQLVAYAHRSNGTVEDISVDVSWESSDEAVMTISPDGEVRGVALGSVTISGSYEGVTGTTTIVVGDAELVSLDIPTIAPVAQGFDREVTAIGTFTDATTLDLTDQVTWESGDGAIATVSAAGVAHGLAVGSTTLTATMGTISDAATLQVTAAMTAFQLTFSGGSTGAVRVVDVDTQVTLATCTATCNVQVATGTTLSLVATSPASYGGFAGACATTTSECVFVPAGPSAAVTVTYALDPDADWERLLYPDEIIYAADFDSLGNLVIGTTNHLTKLDTDGATIWEQTRPVRQVRIGPSNTIYVISGTDLVKLDAAGVVLWTRALGAVAPQPDVLQFVQRLDVGADGVAAVSGGGQLATWASNGTPGWSTAIPSGNGDWYGVGIDSVGNVWAAVDDQSSGERSWLQGFTAAGAAIATQLTPSNEYHGMLVVDPADHLVHATSGHSRARLDRRSNANAAAYSIGADVDDADYAENGVAVAGSSVFWVYEHNDFCCANGFSARRVATAGTITQTIVRTPVSDTNGVRAYDVAGHTDGRRAIVGEYWTPTGPATFSRTGWVQAYTGP